MLVYGALILLTVLRSYATNATEGSGTENYDFSTKLYQQTTQKKSGNLIVSPLSAELVLALTAAGAKGSTYEELQKVLQLLHCKVQMEMKIKSMITYLNQSTDNLKVVLANKIYVADKFKVKETFKQTAITIYNSDIQTVNFKNSETANDINNWVAHRTHDKINNFVDANEINNLVMLLVNTIYFSGKWRTPFLSTATEKRPFYTASGKFEDVDMMQSGSFATYGYRHCGYLQAKFLEIPFRDGNFSMTFILSDAKDGLTYVKNNIDEYVRVDNLKNERVAVSLPKFYIAIESDFKSALQKMGIEELFDKTKANLSGIVEQGNIFVNYIKQKAIINVTESGVEAAAATKAGIGETAVPEPPKYKFNADHPFLFYIKEITSGVILFIGEFVKS